MLTPFSVLPLTMTLPHDVACVRDDGLVSDTAFARQTRGNREEGGPPDDVVLRSRRDLGRQGAGPRILRRLPRFHPSEVGEAEAGVGLRELQKRRSEQRAQANPSIRLPPSRPPPPPVPQGPRGAPDVLESYAGVGVVPKPRVRAGAPRAYS